MPHNNSQYHNRRNSEASQNSRDAASYNHKSYSQSNEKKHPIDNNSNSSYASGNYGNSKRSDRSHYVTSNYSSLKNEHGSYNGNNFDKNHSVANAYNSKNDSRPDANTHNSRSSRATVAGYNSGNDNTRGSYGNSSRYDNRGTAGNYHGSSDRNYRYSDSTNSRRDNSKYYPADNPKHYSNKNTRNSPIRRDYKRPPQKSHFKRNLVLVIIAIVVIFAISVLISVNTLKKSADNLKTELKTAVSLAKDMDVGGFSASIENINDISDNMKKQLSSPVWSIISAVPFYGKDVNSAKELLSIVDDASDKLLVPLAQELKDNPLSAMKVGDGFDVKLITSYFDLLDQVMPDIKSISERMAGIKLKVKPGLVEEYAETLNSALDLVNTLEPYMSLLKTILNADEDRLYLLVAQNSAEIRASDGFPGSIGLIRIRDGILTIGDFRSVYDVFESDEMCTFDVTDQEIKLFSDQFAAWAHDACYNPDFGRVGEIWCQSYEQKNDEKINGIISLTPAIIQELLAACNESVTLSDGTILDGTNASRVLQHDIYYTYLRDDETAYYGNNIADELFAETAQEVMSLATSNLGTDTLMGYVDILMRGATDRTVLIWMKEKSEEEIVKKCGYSGTLNSDPNNPVAGIYINFADPCKLGWFLNIDTELSAPTTKTDGRLEYEVTVKFTNTISGDDLDAGQYIIGSFGGSMFTYMYFFAPDGGIIYDFDSSYGMYIKEDEYKNLALGYRQDVVIDPGETITVKYKIITKQGVTTPLRLENTPTLQKYRNSQGKVTTND